MADDHETILELHRGFLKANTVADTAFLRAHMVPGNEKLLWFNLNQSNYIGVDHICELWDLLRISSPSDKPAEIETYDEHVAVSGDAAWVTYGLHFRADFGPLGKVEQDSRSTEIWQRIDGQWRMVHFHCSNHVPGQMGGL